MTSASLIRRADMDFLLLDWLGADRLAEIPRFSDLSFPPPGPPLSSEGRTPAGYAAGLLQ